MIDDLLLQMTDGKWCLDGVPYSGETKYATGILRWYKEGRYHREDGPAIEWANGYKSWYLRGKQIFTWREYHVLSTLSPEQQVIVKLKYGEQLK